MGDYGKPDVEDIRNYADMQIINGGNYILEMTDDQIQEIIDSHYKKSNDTFDFLNSFLVSKGSKMKDIITVAKVG